MLKHNVRISRISIVLIMSEARNQVNVDTCNFIVGDTITDGNGDPILANPTRTRLKRGGFGKKKTHRVAKR
jgi:hypothetical protein